MRARTCIYEKKFVPLHAFYAHIAHRSVKSLNCYIVKTLNNYEKKYVIFRCVGSEYDELRTK